MTSADAVQSQRWAWATIDLDAVEHNVGVLRSAASVDVWAVVKADGYGHGAVDVARAALGGGAAGLCVALVHEGIDLRAAGLEAPILVFGEQPVSQLDALIEHGMTPTVYTAEYATALAERSPGGLGVHVNVDTGMQRVGITPARAEELIATVGSLAPALTVDAIYTHLACADEPDHPANAEQLRRFDALLDRLGTSCPPVVHIANSAAAMAIPATRRSLVRAGIALYGISPGAGVDHLCGDLRPAMRLESRVTYVKQVLAGSHVAYGWRHRFERDTTVATVPIGYADGVARRLGTLPDRPGADVLIGGRRCPIVGVVTMDQLMVEIGVDHDGASVAVGDPVVLIGEQGDERIRAEDWADRLGTIGYEIVCGITARVPRVAVGRAAR